MRPAPLCILLLASAAAAQGLDDLIGLALDARTAPARRVQTLERIAKDPEGAARLAERGLDPALDPEVIHAVVDTLLRLEDYRAYVARIVPLLSVDRHREKVRQRIQRLGEQPERAAALLEECGRLAREGETAEARRAALLALAEIPQRRALEIMVAVGRADPELRDVVRDHLATWLAARSLEEADAMLRSHPQDSFWDLVKRNVRELREELARRRAQAEEFLRAAPLEEVLRALEEERAERNTRIVASARLKELAAKNGFAPEVVVRVVGTFRTEQARPDAGPNVMANLLETMRLLAKAPRPGEEAPLWSAIERQDLIATVEPLSRWQGSEKDLQTLGYAAVRLLNVVDTEGAALALFAQDFASTDVRKEAIQYLANLATLDESRRVYVGLKLGQLLAGEKDAAVRTQVLSTLTQYAVPVDEKALQTIQGFLTGTWDPPLSDAEVRDCITILAKGGDGGTVPVLFRVLKEYPKQNVRRFAAEEGLLERARRGDAKTHQAILDEMRTLAVAADTPEPVRLAVIEALGRRGTRLAHATLNAIQQAEGLPEALAKAAREAKLELAARLAKPGANGAIERQDLDRAAAILREEQAADPARLRALADEIVRAGDAAKLPVGAARYLRARLHGGQEQLDAAHLRALYDEAFARAREDGLPEDAALWSELLVEYRALLEGSTDPASVQAWIRCTEELAALADARKNKARAAELYLAAAQRALTRNNAARVEELLNKAMATGGVGGDLKPVEQRIRAELEKLAAGPGG